MKVVEKVKSRKYKCLSLEKKQKLEEVEFQEKKCRKRKLHEAQIDEREIIVKIVNHINK